MTDRPTPSNSETAPGLETPSSEVQIPVPGHESSGGTPNWGRKQQLVLDDRRLLEGPRTRTSEFLRLLRITTAELTAGLDEDTCEEGTC